MNFDELLTTENLEQVFNTKIKIKNARGLDGISPDLFELNKESNYETIIKKCTNGSYHFTPLLEKLCSKGRGKAPRVISISTVRDKIVLALLKEYLHYVFADCVNKKLPNSYIKEIGSVISSNIENEHFCCYKADLQNFYGSIDRSILMAKLKERIDDSHVLKLLYRAISTPTIPYGSRKKDRGSHCEKRGVPQGLSISNILASVYLMAFDTTMESMSMRYFRYVDDILVFNLGDEKYCIKPKIKMLVDNLGLTINISKSDCIANSHLPQCIASKTSELPDWINTGLNFEFLGYKFNGTLITIREHTVERFINSIVTYFTKFKRTTKTSTNIEKDKTIFIDELNEKISGAISDHKQYGWIFYFIEINDLTLLYYIDNVISGLFRMLDEFGNVKPVNLKKLSRAFYEAKKSSTSNYIHNYNCYKTFEQKRAFLEKRGWLTTGKEYTIQEIESLFIHAKTVYLDKLELDLAFLY